MTMRMWSRRTGCGRANSWAIAAWKIRSWWPGLAHSTGRSGDPWQNFFLPCLKLQNKWREGSHWRKRYERPRTAYERLCSPGLLSRKQRSQLRERYASLDPFALKDELERRLQQILHPKPI